MLKRCQSLFPLLNVKNKSSVGDERKRLNLLKSSIPTGKTLAAIGTIDAAFYYKEPLRGLCLNRFLHYVQPPFGGFTAVEMTGGGCVRHSVEMPPCHPSIMSFVTSSAALYHLVQGAVERSIKTSPAKQAPQFRTLNFSLSTNHEKKGPCRSIGL